MNPHSSVYDILKSKKTYRNIRKYLKFWGFTHSEQNFFLTKLKEQGFEPLQ
jgi:hypothetical protein